MTKWQRLKLDIWCEYMRHLREMNLPLPPIEQQIERAFAIAWVEGRR